MSDWTDGVLLSDSQLVIEPEDEPRVLAALQAQPADPSNGHWQHPSLLACTTFDAAVAHFGFAPERIDGRIVGLRSNTDGASFEYVPIDRFAAVIAPFVHDADVSSYLEFRPVTMLPFRLVFSGGRVRRVSPGLMWPTE